MGNKVNFILILCALLLLLTFGQNVRGAIFNLVESPLRPVTRKVLEAKIIIKAIPRLAEIVSENQILQEQNNIVNSVQSELASLKTENEQLKKQLNVSRSKPLRLEEVHIFLFSSDIEKTSFYIDKGSRNGISENQSVIYAGNVLVGVIRETFENNARVDAVGNSHISINVRTVRGNIALAKGALDGELILNFISSDEQIDEGEIIVTSGLDGLPANLLVGKVKKIEEKNGGFFKDVYVESAFKKSITTDAFVIIQ